MDPHFDGVIFKTHAEELRRRIEFEHPPFIVLDIRSASEQAKGRIPGSEPTSLQALESGLPSGTSTRTEFIVVGVALDDPGVRPVSCKLRDLGADRVVELAGGTKEWQDLGYALA